MKRCKNLLSEDSLRDGECIRCGKCTLICPRRNISVFIQPQNEKSL